jgi:hypothetical protein
MANDKIGSSEPKPTESGAAAATARLIEAFGGLRPMAKRLSVPVTTVQYWKRAGHIPTSRHADVFAAAKANNLKVVTEALVSATAPGRVENKAAVKDDTTPVEDTAVKTEPTKVEPLNAELAEAKAKPAPANVEASKAEASKVAIPKAEPAQAAPVAAAAAGPDPAKAEASKVAVPKAEPAHAASVAAAAAGPDPAKAEAPKVEPSQVKPAQVGTAPTAAAKPESEAAKPPPRQTATPPPAPPSLPSSAAGKGGGWTGPAALVIALAALVGPSLQPTVMQITGDSTLTGWLTGTRDDSATQDALASLQAGLAAERERVDAATSAVAVLAADAETQAAELNAGLTPLADEIAGNAAAIAALDDRFDTVQRGTAAIPANVIDQLQELRGIAGEVRAEMAALRTEVTDARAAVVGEVDAVVGRVDEMTALVAQADLERTVQLSASVANLQDLLDRVLGDFDALRDQVGGFDTRVSAMESTTVGAQAQLMALLALKSRVDVGQPFGPELAVVNEVAMQSDELTAALADLPVDDNIATYPELIAQLDVDVPMILHAIGDHERDWRTQIYDTVAALVTIRRAPGMVDGTAPRDVLARAQARLAERDLAGALEEMQVLSGPHAAAASAWMMAAQARVAADAAVADAVAVVLGKLAMDSGANG